MNDLIDYAGPFLPEIDFNDFSHETLARMLTMYAKLYIAIDGFWYMTVMDRHGNDEALACDIKAWKIMSKYEKKQIANAMNIKGNNVLSFIKTLQLSPWFIHTKYRVDMENNDSATLTVTYCPTLDALEKEGTGRQQHICSVFEPEVFANYAALFNPAIEVKSLAPLPRESPKDICCRWSFKLKK